MTTKPERATEDYPDSPDGVDGQDARDELTPDREPEPPTGDDDELLGLDNNDDFSSDDPIETEEY